LTYDVSGLDIGETVHLSHVQLPADAELIDSPDEVIVVLAAPNVPVEDELVAIQPEVAGPDLTEDKQKDDFQGESRAAA